MWQIFLDERREGLCRKAAGRKFCSLFKSLSNTITLWTPAFFSLPCFVSYAACHTHWCNRWLANEFPTLMKSPIVHVVCARAEFLKRTLDVEQTLGEPDLSFLDYLFWPYTGSIPLVSRPMRAVKQPSAACSPSRPCHKCRRQLPAPNLLPGVGEQRSG